MGQALMDRDLTGRIMDLGGSLRLMLDDIALEGLRGGSTEALVKRARDLADELTDAVDALGENHGAMAARRMAAYLAANLATLENSIGSREVH